MNPDRFQQVYELYQAMLDGQPEARAKLLKEADPELRREVESLLKSNHDRQGGRLLNRPVWEPAANLLADPASAQLQPGVELGPYRIEAPIGAGGMGLVFRALDTRLGRKVALKICLDQFSARFEREARAISALNHPHICTLHDIGPNYLVMELVEGSTLTERLKPGPLPIESALRYGAQIADALAAAHAKGIVHRDLKPGNIMITKAGVKVLDFGLAKSPQDAALTLGSAVMGTPAYMAPEQLEGRECDARTDIYALGLVLCEMATGNRLTKEQPFETAKLPPQFAHVIERCLKIDSPERWQAASDLREELLWASHGQPFANLPRRKPFPRWLGAVAALVSVGLAGVTAAVWLRWSDTGPTRDRPLMRLSVELGPGAIDGPRPTFAISPDGTRIAFQSQSPNGSQQISVLSLTEITPVTLPGTDGATGPFFSPDGQWLGFEASRKLMKIALKGGAPIVVAEVPAFINGATWGPDGNIVGTMGTLAEVGTQTGLSRVSDSGGVPQPLTHPVGGEATHRWPQYLPGGEYVLFTAHTLLNDFDDARLEVVSVKSGKVKTVLQGGYYGRYLPGGNLVYIRDGVLWGVRFDLRSLETRGPATALLDDIAVSTAWGTARFDFSQNGVFVYRKPVATEWPIVRLDSSGKTEPILTTPKAYYTPRLSPDGRKLAISEGGTTRGNVVVYDLQRNRMTPLTVDGQGHFGPLWTPDGGHVIYRSHYATTGEYSIEWNNADGSGEPQRLLTSKTALLPYSISNDGRRLAYTTENAGYDIWILPLDLGDPEHPKAGKAEPFATTPANELEPVFSPDGRWIAYGSNETRGSRLGSRLKVRPVTPARDGPDRKWSVGAGPGYFPMWSRNGRELFYVNPADKKIMVVTYSAADGSFIAEMPRVWSPEPILLTELFSSLDLFPDGKGFVAFPSPDKRAEQEVASHLSVLENFFDEVRRRVPGHAK